MGARSSARLVARLVVVQIALASLLAVVHCGGDGTSAPPRTSHAGGSPTTSAQTASKEAPVSGVDRIRARVATCARISKGLYKTDEEPRSAPASIPVCELGAEAVYWTADMDIDCDGRVTPRCNAKTDPAFQPGTAAESSTGTALTADELPYVVVPSPSATFDYRQAGLELGTVVMVIFGDKIEYGIIGDTGPPSIIGEASYAMAKSLGIDPDPSTGGTDGPVLYIAFKGKASVVKKNEDHAEAVTIGTARATALFGPLQK